MSWISSFLIFHNTNRSDSVIYSHPTNLTTDEVALEIGGNKALIALSRNLTGCTECQFFDTLKFRTFFLEVENNIWFAMRVPARRFTHESKQYADQQSKLCFAFGEFVIKFSYIIFKFLHGSICDAGGNTIKCVLKHHFDTYLEALTNKFDIYSKNVAKYLIQADKVDYGLDIRLQCEALNARLKNLCQCIAYSYIYLGEKLIWSDLEDEDIKTVTLIIKLFCNGTNGDMEGIAEKFELGFPLHVYIHSQRFRIKQLKFDAFNITLFLSEKDYSEAINTSLSSIACTEFQTLSCYDNTFPVKIFSTYLSLMCTTVIYKNFKSNDVIVTSTDPKLDEVFLEASEVMCSRNDERFEVIISLTKGHWINLRKTEVDSLMIFTKQIGDNLVFSEVISLVESLVEMCCHSTPI